MSGLGLLATALAGGAGVIGKQAGDDIEQGRRADMMRQQADIEEQMRMRLAERQEQMRRSGVLWETSGEGGAAKLAARGKELEQSSDAAIGQARGMIPVAVEQATAVEGAKRDATTAAGSDPKYIKALRAISAASAAPDRTDYKGRELDNAIKQIAVDNAKTITKLKGEFASATPERKQAINEELSVLTGKDADKFLPVPIKDESGAITGYKVFDTKRGVWAESAGEVDPYAVPKRDAKPAPAAKPAAAAKDEGPGMLESLRKTVSGALDGGSKVGNAIESVRAKVRSGQPLTAEESAIAKKYSLTQG